MKKCKLNPDGEIPCACTPDGKMCYVVDSKIEDLSKCPLEVRGKKK